MTKAERMAILLWSEKVNDEAQKRDEYFAQLQQLTREARLIVTCNPLKNRDQLQGTQFATRADILYDQYIKAGAKYDAMMELVGELSEVTTDPLSGGNGWIVSRHPEARGEEQRIEESV